MWLGGIGYKGYIISIERIILGDLENSDIFSYIILVCKHIIYGAMKEGKQPHIQHFYCELKNIYYCRIGIYRATKILRKADFSVFHVYFILRASEFYRAICWTKQ